MFEEKAD